MGLIRERLAPYVLAILVAICFRLLGIGFPKSENLLAAGVSLGAILTGFLATNMTLFASVESRLMRRIRNGQYFDTLMKYLRESIWLSMAFSASSVLGFFIVSPKLQKCFAYAWLFVAVASIATFCRVTEILLLILAKKDGTPHEPDPKPKTL